MLRILVDADAAPVKQEVFRVALRYGITVILVANSPINITEEDWLESVVVSGQFVCVFLNLDVFFFKSILYQKSEDFVSENINFIKSSFFKKKLK